MGQNRDEGVVTLDGHVPAGADKAQAESIAKSIAGGQVVADQIAVTPPGVENDAKAVNSDLDDGIKKNLDEALIQRNYKKAMKCDVKNGVVTLTGEVRSEAGRKSAAAVAAGSECAASSERATVQGSEGYFAKLGLDSFDEWRRLRKKGPPPPQLACPGRCRFHTVRRELFSMRRKVE